MMYSKCVFFIAAVLFLSAEVELLPDYDFVVVGSGSAGAPLANRLSASGRYTVLVLEKGGPAAAISEVPALAPMMVNSENADPYYVEKQPNTFLGLKNQQVVWLKGKGLGGTSLMNYMAYTFGHRRFYDDWAASGLPGWSWSDVLPFFREIETAHTAAGNTSFRGQHGELHIRESDSKSEAARAFVRACKQAGLKFLEDYNAEDPFGIGYFQANIKDGRRCDMGTAFLKSVQDRRNLDIQLNSLVTRLIINANTKTVEAVEYMKDNRIYHVKVNREVILSAGALASPQILMLSGIGPKEHLEEMGIRTIQDLPVGKIVYDHLIYPGLIFTVNNTEIVGKFTDLVNPRNWERLIRDNAGPLTSPGPEALGFVKTPVSKDTDDYPDIEYLFFGGSFNSDLGTSMKKEWSISDEAYNALWKHLEGKPVWSAFPLMFRPKSYGHLKLKSRDPTEYPWLYSGYMTDPENEDIKTMIAAIRMIQKLPKTPALAIYNSTLQMIPTPGCEHTESDSDAYWECHLRHFATTCYHQQTTCKMGTKDDPTAVVDNELKVYGMTNLRVADLSILPAPITAHPSVPSAMIGVKAAHMILQRHS